MDIQFLSKFMKYRYWKYFVICFYFLICLYVLNLSRKVSFLQVSPGNSSKVLFTISFCYDLAIRNEKCKPSYNYDIDKIDFPDNCSFTRPIECYTKGFKNLQIGQILKKFEKCKINKLVEIDRTANISLKL